MISLCIDARITDAVGIGRFIRELVPLLNRPPFQILLLVNREGEEWCKNIEQRVFSAPIYSVKEQLLFPLKIPRCDLFWSPHYNVPLLPIRAKKRIVTIHDVCHIVYGQFFPWFKRSAAHFVMKNAFLRSDCVATISEFSRSEMVRCFGRARHVNVIPLAVDHFLTKIRNDVRHKYGLPSRFLLFVSNLLPHKNCAVLVEAFRKLKIPDLGLVIVGKGEKKEGDPLIFWLGKIPDADLSSLYKEAELFVFPSLYEGFGLPPLEAMLCGCPTLVSSAGSIPEICGDASLYFNPLDVDELTKKITKVVGNQVLKSELISKGRERAKKFSWAETARCYHELFERLSKRDSH